MSKKLYGKPNVQFYDLSLSSDLSSGCQIRGHFAPNDCPVTLPDFPLFVLINDSVDACEMTPPEEDDFICYHVPFADNSIFGS